MCLYDDATEALGRGRRRDHHVGEHVGRRHVAAFIDDLHGTPEPELRGPRLELAAITCVARTDEEAAHIAAAQERHCLDQHELALPARQAARQHHHRRSVRKLPLPGEGHEALGTNVLGRKPHEVDAARYHPQAVGADAIDLRHMRAHEIRDRDHALAFRHHGVVDLLQPRALAVGVVKGGDEVPAGAPRGPERAPGRRAAARMDDIDRVLLDDLDQPVDVRAHHQRVLGSKRQRDVSRAGALDLAHQRAA